MKYVISLLTFVIIAGPLLMVIIGFVGYQYTDDKASIWCLGALAGIGFLAFQNAVCDWVKQRWVK